MKISLFLRFVDTNLYNRENIYSLYYMKGLIMRLSQHNIEFLRKALEGKGIFESVQKLHDKNPSVLKELCNDIIGEECDKGVPGWTWNENGDMVEIKAGRNYDSLRYHQAISILEYLGSNEYHVGNKVFMELSDNK